MRLSLRSLPTERNLLVSMPEKSREVAHPDQLEVQFDREISVDLRVAAETAYALAFWYRNHDFEGSRRFDLAKVWALRTIELLDALPSDTIDQVASTRQSVGGAAIPELLHSGVVRERLGDVLI